jgi:hypothetical protein
VQNGLYKTEYETPRGAGRGVICARDGRLLGGNSNFAFVGTFDDRGDTIVAEVSTVRHNFDPSIRPLLLADEITVKLTGKPIAGGFAFEGGTTGLPGIAFKSVMTPIDCDDGAPRAASAPQGIRDGLYSNHIRMLDGVDGGNTGVMLLDRGIIRGGDAFFDYIGTYSSANGRWKGEIVNHEHTPSRGERPIFGGYEVGIGFSGTYSADGAEAQATALAGKRSIRFHAVLKLIAAI